MLTEKQLAIRRTGVTATDAVVLAGLSPYSGASEHTIYCEKTGIELPPRTGPRLLLGQELEPVILKHLAEDRELRLVPGDTVRSHLWEHHLATPDALHVPIDKPLAVAEAKAVGLHYADAWGDDDEGIPDHVIAQVHWQMHVTGLHLGYVGALIGTEVRTYRVERDDELIAALCEVVDRFWTDHVVPKRPPPIDGSKGASEMLRGLFPRDRGPIVKATEEVEERARAYLAFKREVAEAEARVEGAKQALIAACGEASGIQGNGWRLRYAWRDAVEVRAFTRAAGRAFDLREVQGGRR